MIRRMMSRSATTVTALGLLTVPGGCGLTEKPTAHVTGVKLQNVSLRNATMRFDVEVANPYAVALPMSNVDYALASQGQQFLSGKADVQGEVPAKGSKVLGVPVRISYVELINAVRGARPGATVPYTANLGLSVAVPVLGVLRLPMKKEGEIAIPSGQGLMDRLRGVVE